MRLGFWTEKNNRLFNNKESYVHHLLDKVKLCSVWWMNATHITLVELFIFGGRSPLFVWASVGLFLCALLCHVMM